MPHCPYCNTPFEEAYLLIFQKLDEGDYFTNSPCCKRELNINTYYDPIAIFGISMSESEVERKKLLKEAEEEEFTRSMVKPKYHEILLKHNNIFKNISYSDLLDTEEWETCRKLILQKYGYRCSNCHKMATKYQSSELMTTSVVWTGYYWLDDENNADFYKDYEKNIYWDGGPSESQLLVIAEKPYHLQVHHKFYVIDRLPWDYRDTELISLCNWCHWEFHENNTVKVYSEQDSQFIDHPYTICSRCNGTGNLPEYSHVAGGVCFKCGGQRYFLL